MLHVSSLEDWMPSVEQVMGTLPPVFVERYPSTYAIVDASEIFIETPTDLYMQSSTWSNYNLGTLLIASLNFSEFSDNHNFR